MRPFQLLALSTAFFLPLAATAQTSANSHVAEVTLFQQGAEVTRVVSVDLTAGANEVVIADLPAGLVPEALRILAPAGVTLGAYSMQTDRPSSDIVGPTPERQAAEDALAKARAELTAAAGALDMVQADIAAADARVAFAQGVKLADQGTNAATLRDMAAAIGAEVAAARQAAVTSRAALPPLELAVAHAAQAVARSEAVLAIVPAPPESHGVLTVDLEAANGGKVDLVIRHFVENASWSPVHDWYLTTGDAPALRLERAALVQQSSGEDWTGVALTLSTAQPGRQASPSVLWPQLRQTTDFSKGEVYETSSDMIAAATPEPMMEPEMALKSVDAVAAFQGDIVTYVYPRPANVAAGRENLRLSLDSKDLTPRLFAQAVPSHDRTAFAMAEITNDTGEIILPAQSFLYRDGNFMGVEWHDQIAAGDKAELAFGAIDQIRLTQNMPNRNEGDRGFITSTTELTETRVMKVENLGAQAWDIRLMAGVPYSEQEELVAEWTADLAPTEVDVKGQRGILAWDFPLAPGQAQELTLTHSLTWPEGKVLQ